MYGVFGTTPNIKQHVGRRFHNRMARKPGTFYKLATIHIPQQVFDTPEQNEFCENLSFTPWHTVPEHKPLGGINRMRKVIYERISQLRHEMNATKKIRTTLKTKYI